MSNSSKRNGDVELLHPAIRDKVKAIHAQLHKEKIPFEVFEAFRTPERQASLYAQGRTKPGNKVTWVGPWGSIHQYGLAVDFVLKPKGIGWSWDDQGAEAAFWTRMHELAKENDMTPLYNKKGRLIEKPHIQLVGISSKELRKGNYPPGGDEIWAETLGEMIDNWRGSGAPPKPELAPVLPAIDDTDMAELEAEAGNVAVSLPRLHALTSMGDADTRFQRMHGFVKNWEGGFVNNPRDNGGATNMGITQGTLENWRGEPVSVEDVRNLTREEADAILRANYYTVCRCAEMPDRTAMVVYNGAVLHGPRRSIKFLQSAFNGLGLTVDGKPLDVDGLLGPKTMSAVRKVDSGALASAYMDEQDGFFRRHEDFDVFGNGWLNRLASLREFVQTLPHGEGLLPKSAPKVADAAEDSTAEEILTAALTTAPGEAGKDAAVGAVVKAVLKEESEPQRESRLLTILRAVLEHHAGAEGQADPGNPAEKEPLTPVNAAFGETVGRLLDGRKSIIGVLGMFLTVLLPDSELTGPLITFLETHESTLLTILATFTGWGFLGKIDKAVSRVNPEK
ncbi:MAG: glycosyl hydrolase 108 family protein [Pseudomonadota bacterium]